MVAILNVHEFFLVNGKEAVLRNYLLPAALTLAVFCSAIKAQPVIIGIFPPEEFAARRARVIEKIGDGVAVLQGTTERPGEQPLRQSTSFTILCGVIEPRAILLVEGKTKRTTLFLAAGGSGARECRRRHLNRDNCSPLNLP